MDIQVLNEIANPARQASLVQAKSSASTQAQLKALKGNPVLAPENFAPAAFDDTANPVQEPVTPDISSVARAASAYSSAVGDGLNPDEFNAIQDLAGRVRVAVFDFLSQPGLEQAENAATVVTSNPEAVQDLTSNVEQAVVDALNLPAVEGEGVAEGNSTSSDLPEILPAVENFISLERVTNGAEPNNPVVAAGLTRAEARAGENTSVETPLTVEEVSERGDFRVAVASPAFQPALTDENIRVETPARGEVVVSQQEPVSRSETPAVNSNQVSVATPGTALPNVQASENIRVETPATREVVAPQQAAAGRSEAVPANAQEVATPDPNVEVSERVRVETPVNRPETPAVNSEQVPVTTPGRALPNVQASENVQVETPARGEVAVPQNAPASRPEVVAADAQEVVTPEPASSNVQAGENVRVETPETREVVVPQQTPASRPETPVVNSEQVPVSNGPELQNTQAQNIEVGHPVSLPAPTVDHGQRPESSPAQIVDAERVIPSPAKNQTASGPPNPQPASGSQPLTTQHNDLFEPGSAAVNPENIRDLNELVSSVVDNEFSSEAKKIFSEPKVIRTVADLADFILERLREIITSNQLQRQSQPGGETLIS